MTNYNTVSIDEVLANVKMMLSSFDEAGLIDDVELIRHTDWIINRLGISMLEEHDLILEVEDSKAPMPVNFKQLHFLYQVKASENTPATHVKYFFGHPHTWTVRDYAKHVCYHKCCVTEEHDEITRQITVEGKVYNDTYCDKKLLSCSPAVAKKKIHPDCPNVYCTSPNYFNFDNNNFYFNFEEGTVFLRYSGSRIDDDGYPEIIDDPYILKAVQDYLIYQGLLKIYYNSEVDVAQRMQKAEIEHANSLKEALFIDKLPKYKDWVAYGKQKGKSLGIFNLSGRADANQKHHHLKRIPDHKFLQ